MIMAEKTGGETDFYPTLAFDFFLLNVRNPPLFVKWWKMDILSLLETNLSPWFKPKGSQQLIQSCRHDLKKLAAEGCLSWPFWGSALVAVRVVGRRGLLYGIVQYQAIMVVYGLFCLVERGNIKCHWKVATRIAFLGKKKKMMNSNHTTSCLVYSIFCTIFKTMLFLALGF
jgi:hypothetical protein